jgi:hypothetical protein
VTQLVAEINLELVLQRQMDKIVEKSKIQLKKENLIY